MAQPELNKSSMSTASSSSSDSTSLSKYMLSINSQILPKKTSASHDSISKKSIKQQNNLLQQHAVSAVSIDTNSNGNNINNDVNESMSSNESISSKVSSNSSSSHSTTLSMISNNKTSSKSKLVTPPASASHQQHVSLSSRSNRNLFLIYFFIE